MTIQDIASFLRKLNLDAQELAGLLDHLTRDGLTPETQQQLSLVINRQLARQILEAPKSPAAMLLAECQRQLDTIVHQTTLKMADITAQTELDLVKMSSGPMLAAAASVVK